MEVDAAVGQKKAVQFSNSVKVTKKLVNKEKKKKTVAKNGRSIVNTPIEPSTEKVTTSVARRKEGKKVHIMTEEERSAMKAKYRERKNIVRKMMKGAGKKRREVRLENERVEAEKRLASEAFGAAGDVKMQEDEQPAKKRRRA